MQTSTLAQLTITTPGSNGTTQTIVGPAASARIAELSARRSEITARLEEIQTRRHELIARIDGRSVGPDVARMTKELQSLTTEATQLRVEVAAIDRALVNTNAVAVTEVPTQPFPAKMVTTLATIGVMFVVLLPLSIAMAVRLWRRPASRSANQLSPAVEDRLNRLEQGVDAIAIEMERVSEGQRYLTKLLSSDKLADKVPR
jgi:hypothetical protein